MPIDCTVRMTLTASPATSLSALADAANWSDWARDLDRVELLPDADPAGPTLVRVVVSILGEEHDAVVEVLVDPDAGTVCVALGRSEALASLTATFGFVSEGRGTGMHGQLHIAPTQALSARVERMVSRKIETALTRDFVRYVERAQRGRG